MEVFFNELSLVPSCSNRDEARNKVLILLDTMKALNDHDFNILRTHNNFYADDLGCGYTFSDFINDPNVSGIKRLLLRTIVRNPFIADDESYEAEAFVLNSFQTLDTTNKPTSPEGIAAAHVSGSHTVSLTGHAQWETDIINLDVTNAQGQTTVESVINFYNVASVSSKVYTDWVQTLSAGLQLNSAANISQVFPASQFEFESRAVEDILFWFYNDKRYLIKIRDLINDIHLYPFKGGKGHTETLGSTGGKASKRIVKKDRIVYTYTQQKITIHQCRGHYDDH